MEVDVRIVVIGVWALAIAGCGDKDGPDDSDDVPLAPTVAELGVPTAFSVTWTTDAPGTSRVEYGVGGAFDQVSPTTPSGTDHAVKLVLLKANTAYQARAVTELEDGTRLVSEPVTIDVAPPPQGMPRLTPDVLDASRSEVLGGYLLTTTLGQGPSYVGIHDADGDWVWWAEMDAADLSTARARLSADGRSVLYNVYQTDKKADQGWIVRASLDGTEETWTRTAWAHHDFVELPGGSYGWLGYEQRMLDAVGGTPPEVTVGGQPTVIDVGPGPYPIATDIVYEGPEGLVETDTPTNVWSFYDDYALAPSWVCTDMVPHTQGVADPAKSFLPGWYEWTHSNSIAYVEATDSYYVGARYLDALLRIGRDGTLHWQLGGELDDFTWTGEPFEHPHVSDIWDGGMLLFDNRDHSGVSRVVEIHWDEAQKTAEVVWEFPRPDGETLTILGDARRLPNGNRLIAWSGRGELAEVTPEGEVVYRAYMGLGAIMTRVEFFTRDDLTY